MSQQEPAFYELEFFGDAPFWAQAGDAPRRTFLMPLSDPTRFVAFGVVGPSDTLLFVARGRVREHLGEFITRMSRAEARVELYERPPLPWHIVKQYSSDEPYESYETEGPKNPPVNGLAAYGGGADVGSDLWKQQVVAPICGGGLGWPEGHARREVIVIPVGCSSDFLAFGVCRAQPGDATSKDLFVFAARGEVESQLGEFIDRMKRMGATVQLHDWPPVGYVRDYIKKYYSALFAACSTASPSAADAARYN